MKKSEDTSLLKNEIDKGQKYLMQLAALRDECANLSVSKNARSVFFLRKFSYLDHSTFPVLNRIFLRLYFYVTGSVLEINKNLLKFTFLLFSNLTTVFLLSCEIALNFKMYDFLILLKLIVQMKMR